MRFLAVLSTSLACAACASLDSERVLSPAWSRHSTAGGGVETEALAGAVQVRRARPDGQIQHHALRPFYYADSATDGSSETRFLVPLGSDSQSDHMRVWQLLPLARWERRPGEEGGEVRTFFALPGLYWSRRADGRVIRAWFPFSGVVEDFLSYDRIEFTLFPIWLRTVRDNDQTKHILWPIISWTRPKNPALPGARGSKVLPFYSRLEKEGSYDRWTLLWPILHWQENDLRLGPELSEERWMVFPLLGRSQRGQRDDWVLLWPFFGWGSDPRTGYRAFDAPWPLVRWLDAPTEGIVRRRVWPFWSYFKDPTMESTWAPFPLVNWRTETYDDSTVEAFDALPFWQSSTRRDGAGGERTWRKLWPLWQDSEREPWEHEWAFPALNPLWRTPEVDEMYAWMWELWHHRRDHDIVQQRSWLGLWRREADEVEDRRNLSVLWARRSFDEEAGQVAETSILFGLLRWREAPDGLEWLAPAMPGPGWPMERGRRSE